MINNKQVHPDLADVQGNTALMYATCGNQTDIMHFLIEAGASVNGYNDACLTPLSVALMFYIAVSKDIPMDHIEEAFVPSIPVTEPIAIDWNITRQQEVFLTKPQSATSIHTMNRQKSSSIRRSSQGTFRPRTSQVSKTSVKRKSIKRTQSGRLSYDSELFFPDDHYGYLSVSHDYQTRVLEVFPDSSKPKDIAKTQRQPYIFDAPMIDDIIKDKVQKTGANKIENKKATKSEKSTSKSKKKEPKSNLEALNKSAKAKSKEIKQITEDESKIKLTKEMLDKIELTILKLLLDGADPTLVTCPQPALIMALASGSTELVRSLVNFVDVNAVDPKSSGSRPLDMALSGQLSEDTLSLVKILLEKGASTQPPDALCGSLRPKGLGPYTATRLAREKTTGEPRRAIDAAMDRRVDLLSTFITSPKAKLNEKINEANQTVLVKMFDVAYFKGLDSSNRQEILTTLVLYGADP
ncbi:unnamed protein product [Plutella xylostella]|uniref:(diamondback moth) hypothetical protein n=1 Tax=Plutella xylostella TaxID=51655 RepID=A0A8S4G7S1_PLUXY|nr:unnamed protein product [Plutella xylostella]